MGLCTVTILSIGSIVHLFGVPAIHQGNKTELIWYEKEVIYEINLAKFYDSNQDGIGDLQGNSCFCRMMIE